MALAFRLPVYVIIESTEKNPPLKVEEKGFAPITLNMDLGDSEGQQKYGMMWTMSAREAATKFLQEGGFQDSPEEETEYAVLQINDEVRLDKVLDDWRKQGVKAFLLVGHDGIPHKYLLPATGGAKQIFLAN